MKKTEAMKLVSDKLNNLRNVKSKADKALGFAKRGLLNALVRVFKSTYTFKGEEYYSFNYDEVLAWDEDTASNSAFKQAARQAMRKADRSDELAKTKPTGKLNANVVKLFDTLEVKEMTTAQRKALTKTLRNALNALKNAEAMKNYTK